jgi:hypothetical protein
MIKAADIWLPAWLRRNREISALGVRHVVIAVCDHFEPLQREGKADALARVNRWRKSFPEAVAGLKDCSGNPPRHTFFYPIEKYDPDIVGEIAGLCVESACEIDVHLHHDKDNSENLRSTLRRGIDQLAGHDMLAEDDTGTLRYGFIHGNWALDHSHPQGWYCGVSDELAILAETGCYADFTLPSAPDRTQTRVINSVYYAREDGLPKSHDRGRLVVSDRNGRQPRPDELLIVQGPLGLNWSRRKYGVLPRVENGDLTAKNPPTMERFQVWLDCDINVVGRPNWLFVKLHTHGARRDNMEMLLGKEMRSFHEALSRLAERQPSLRYYYVSAREMVNMIHAAEAGHSGDPSRFRDYRYWRRGNRATPVHSPSAPGSAAEAAG